MQVFLYKLKNFNQQQPGQAVVGDHSHQIVHRGDQRTGRHCRVDVDFMEEERHQRTHQAGDDDGQQEGDAHAAGNQKGGTHGVSFKEGDVDAQNQKGHDAQQGAVAEAYLHFR